MLLRPTHTATLVWIMSTALHTFLLCGVCAEPAWADGNESDGTVPTKAVPPGDPTLVPDETSPLADKKPRGPSVFIVPYAAADPNRGFSAGAIIPVFSFNDEAGTAEIWAPGIAWNETVGVMFAGRFLYYGPDDLHIRTEVIQATGPFTDCNGWLIAPKLTDWFGVELRAGYRNDQFQRFFGIGPEAEHDTSYAVKAAWVNATAWFRPFPQERNSDVISPLPGLRIGFDQMVEYADIRESVVEQDQTTDTFPDVPGVSRPATTWWHGVRLRIDTRDDETFPTSGIVFDATWSIASRDLGATFDATRVRLLTTGFFTLVKDHLSVAMRGEFESVSGPGGPDRIPFRALASLGGHNTFRGGPVGRFVDRRAISGSLELRWSALRPDIFGYTLEIEITPFIDVGQVFSRLEDIELERFRFAIGIGIRFMVRPRVVASVDLGVSRDGAVLFTRLSYPF